MNNESIRQAIREVLPSGSEFAIRVTSNSVRIDVLSCKGVKRYNSNLKTLALDLAVAITRKKPVILEVCTSFPNGSRRSPFVIVNHNDLDALENGSTNREMFLSSLKVLTPIARVLSCKNEKRDDVDHDGS